MIMEITACKKDQRLFLHYSCVDKVEHTTAMLKLILELELHPILWSDEARLAVMPSTMRARRMETK